MVLQEEVLRRQREQEEAQHRQEEERQAQEEALRRVEERRREDEERKQRDEFLRKQVSAGESPARALDRLAGAGGRAAEMPKQSLRKQIHFI